MQFYVDINASRSGDGTKEHPFQYIQDAANLAMPGDEVLVFPGVYRENVNPVHPGTEGERILYRSLEPLKAIIKGSEPVRDWEHMEGTVWRARIKNTLFTERNPFTTLISGDWFIAAYTAHTGDVFLGGKSMYEVTDLEKVRHPAVSKASWDPDFSVYTWYTEQDADSDETVIYANFQGKDPNEEDVEITVRSSCFYPQEEGVGYITLSGFTVTQAATQWAPPTAYQEGMIGPHWSKGWIIEDCDISESKCSGISLGKYLQKENDNKWLKWKYKDGTQTERDCICQAQREGWTKERIGSHVVRRCNIHDCGQTGIVGHLGGVFSVIEDNHIHHINNKQNLAGAEIGGIKMHAAIDCIFRKNHIHHCTRGIWLDWQAQGTRVTQNFFHHNTVPNLSDDAEPSMETLQGVGEDVFVEVSHGPTLFDNNLFLSARALKLATQGVALVHNLIAGSLNSVNTGTDNGALSIPSPRYTPYHVPHQTEVAGFMTILHGDMKIYNNVFVQQQVNPALRMMEQSMSSDGNAWDDGCVSAGTMRFDGYETFEEWKKDFEGYCGMGAPASDKYYKRLPVWTGGNAFFNGAKPWEKEEGFYEDLEHTVTIEVKEQESGWTFETNLYDYLPKNTVDLIDTQTLGIAFEPEQPYENPDGTPITFNCDYYGKIRPERPTAGPIEKE